jgi:succinyl-CoA synthetase beta subunit
MVAGGGASVIYADTVADLGFAPELGNYGEYSGAPNTNETYQCAPCRRCTCCTCRHCWHWHRCIRRPHATATISAAERGRHPPPQPPSRAHHARRYARTVLDCATASPDGRPRALLIGGGIANFTDVAATFKGIIAALRERAEALRACNMHIFVRRGGPNYQAGLAAMRALGQELGVPIQVYGPETSMTGICEQAIKCIQAAA